MEEHAPCPMSGTVVVVEPSLKPRWATLATSAEAIISGETENPRTALKRPVRFPHVLTFLLRGASKPLLQNHPPSRWCLKLLVRNPQIVEAKAMHSPKSASLLCLLQSFLFSWRCSHIKTPNEIRVLE